MTKLELVQLQRRFEWELARNEYTRAAGTLVAGKTHDLLNLVQIVQLASGELATRCDETGQEFVADLIRAAHEAEVSLKGLMAVARPEREALRGPAVGAVVAETVEAMRPGVPIDLHLEIAPESASALSAEELRYLVRGLALDASESPGAALLVRDRTISGAPWIEFVRAADRPGFEGELSFDLRAVEMLVVRAGGELSCAERRGGGSELVVALPAR